MMKITLRIYGPEGSKSVNLEIPEGAKVKDILEISVKSGLVDPAMIEEPYWIMIGRKIAFPEDALKEEDNEITVMRFAFGG
ncbi:MAG: hypothetical protein QXX56_01215 [Candidatus Bathyarchaeia archaeon]